MKLERFEFIKILDTVRNAVAGKETLEQLTHFNFTGREIITFNNKLAIFYPFKTNFVCSVRADLLYKQLSKFKSKEIDVTLEESTLHLSGEDEEAKLVVSLEKDDQIFQQIEAITSEWKGADVAEAPDNLLKALEKCSYAASRDVADGTLCCVLVRDDIVFATDNYRATRIKLNKKINEEILLSAENALELRKYDISDYVIGQNWIHFYCPDNIVICARRIIGKYADTADLLEMFDFETEKMRLPDEIIEALDFVSVLVASDKPLERNVVISIKKGKMSCKVEKVSEMSKRSITLPAIYKDLDFSFMINIVFLKEIIQKSAATTIHYNTGLGRALFQSDDLLHIIQIDAR